MHAVRQREGEAIEQLDRSRAETLNDKREVERLTAQVAELQRGLQTANERAAFAEQQAERFAGELRRSQEEAELQQFRALHGPARREVGEARETPGGATTEGHNPGGALGGPAVRRQTETGSCIQTRYRTTLENEDRGLSGTGYSRYQQSTSPIASTPHPLS